MVTDKPVPQPSGKPAWKLQTLAPGDPNKQVIVTVDFALLSSGPTLGSVLVSDHRDHAVLRVDAVSDLAAVSGYWTLAELGSRTSGAGSRSA